MSTVGRLLPVVGRPYYIAGMSPKRVRLRRRFWHRYALVETSDAYPTGWVRSFHATRTGGARAQSFRIAMLINLRAGHVHTQLLWADDPRITEAINRCAGALWKSCG